MRSFYLVPGKVHEYFYYSSALLLEVCCLYFMGQTRTGISRTIIYIIHFISYTTELK